MKSVNRQILFQGFQMRKGLFLVVRRKLLLFLVGFFFFNNLLTPSPRKALMNEVVNMVTFSLPFFSALYQFRPFKL